MLKSAKVTWQAILLVLLCCYICTVTQSIASVSELPVLPHATPPAGLGMEGAVSEPLTLVPPPIDPEQSMCL